MATTIPIKIAPLTCLNNKNTVKPKPTPNTKSGRQAIAVLIAGIPNPKCTNPTLHNAI